MTELIRIHCGFTVFFLQLHFSLSPASYQLSHTLFFLSGVVDPFTLWQILHAGSVCGIGESFPQQNLADLALDFSTIGVTPNLVRSSNTSSQVNLKVHRRIFISTHYWGPFRVHCRKIVCSLGGYWTHKKSVNFYVGLFRYHLDIILFRLFR